MTDPGRLIWEARLEREVEQLDTAAQSRLHLARELRRCGRSRLAAGIERELLAEAGVDVTAHGLARQLSPVPPRGWFAKLRERLGDADPPAIF